MSENSEVVYKSGCLNCQGGCGILVTVKDGKVVRLAGDPDSPNNEGKLCPKGWAGIDLLYHPDRLKYPLKRIGRRGQGKWERISWDRALGEIAEKLMAIREEFGPEAVAVGDGTKLDEVAWIADLFAFHFGTPNNFGSGRAQCFRPRRVAGVWTYGSYFTPEYANRPACMLFWGDQPDVSNHNTILGRHVIKALKHHPKIIVVDPRKTYLAKRAEVWLPLRPGTDCAVALGMLNVIVKENRFDREFVEKWSNGPFLIRQDSGELLTDASGAFLVWDAATGSALPADTPGVSARLTGAFEVNGIRCKTVWTQFEERLEDYPPEKVADIAWVDPDTIRRAARLYADSSPACMGWGVGVDQCVSTHQSVRALCILVSITGNLDVPGGNINPIPKHKGVVTEIKNYADKQPAAFFEKQLGGDKYKLLAGPHSRLTAHYPTILNAILDGEPYPVKAWINVGANPLVGWANSHRVFEALKAVDLSVVCELFMTPTAQMADYVLPGATYFEKSRLVDTDCVNPFGNVATQKVVEPLGESRDEFDIFGDLLRRCGLDKDWHWNSVDDFLDQRLRACGLTWEAVKAAGGVWDEVQYRKYETDYYRPGGGFKTPTGKVEIFSTYWRKLGYDPLPIYFEPPESPISTPELAETYPFVITTGGKLPFFFHTQHRQIGRLRKHHPYPRVQIHPDAAVDLGISDGDWVWVESPRGRCLQKAQFFEDMHPGVIHAEHGWWYPEASTQGSDLEAVLRANVNYLTSDETRFIDRGFGGNTLRGFLARVYRAERGTRTPEGSIG